MKYAENRVPRCTSQMQAACSLGEPVPAEDPQAEERRLEEERQQCLDRERGAEDVADEARVVAPVHAELELLHDAGDDAHGEVDQEELAEELGQRAASAALPVRTQAVS